MRDLEPPPKRFKGLPAWCMKAWEFITEGAVRRGSGTLMRRSSRGTTIVGLGGDDGNGGGGEFPWRGPYNPAATYALEDLVICGARNSALELTEQENPYRPGTYIATGSITPGELPPGIDPTTAVAHAELTDDGVSAIVIDDPGAGYASAPTVTITGGGGTGATAHAVLDGYALDSIVVDDPGSGYGSPPDVTIGDPTMVNYWADFARGNHPKKIFQPRSPDRSKQRITFDAGRDVGVLPMIELRLDRTDLAGATGSVLIDLNDIPAMTGAATKIIKLREKYVCNPETFVQSKIMILCSEEYPT